MRVQNLLMAALIFATILNTTSAQSQERVRLVIGSHLPRATEVGTVYSASCGTVQYELAVSAAKKTVVLRKGGELAADLSGTTVGARLLEQDVLVEVGFNCPHNALNIFLKGVKLVDLGPPIGFRDHISFRLNGEVSVTAPQEVRVDELATPVRGVNGTTTTH